MSRDIRALGRELRPEPEPERRAGAVAVLAWVLRHLPELLLGLVLLRAWQWSAARAGLVPTGFTTAGLLLAALWWDRSRPWLLGVGGCLLTRSRLRGALAELRLSGRAGRLPVIVGLLPSGTGERVWLLCPVRVSAADLADEADRLAAACFARGVRVREHRRWSALVVLDVVRRDGPAERAPAGSALVPRLPARVARHRA